MDLGLRERVCVVTGSTAGIGLATVRLLVDEGARVVTSGRSGAPGVGETLHVEADLSRPGEPERVVERAVAELGGLDCLVNNVGAARQARFEDVLDDEWDEYWQLNVMSHVRAIRAALPACASVGAARSSTSPRPRPSALRPGCPLLGHEGRDAVALAPRRRPVREGRDPLQRRHARADRDRRVAR